MKFYTRMLTRPAWHEAKTEAQARESEAEAEAEKFLEAKATMHEAEARYCSISQNNAI